MMVSILIIRHRILAEGCETRYYIQSPS